MLNKEAEKYVVLLLGVKDDPIPSLWHLHKEMFMASRAIPQINEFFDFAKHYTGPFSLQLDKIINEPLHYSDAYQTHQDLVSLTQSGKNTFQIIINEYKNKFSDLLQTLKLIREMYDKLEKDELLFLIYQTHPEYIKISDQSYLNKDKRIKLVNSLFSKGLITEERYTELKEIEQ